MYACVAVHGAVLNLLPELINCHIYRSHNILTMNIESRSMEEVNSLPNESRCALKLGPTAKIQNLLNDSFSDFVGIGMGHKSYFLHLLWPMSFKKGTKTMIHSSQRESQQGRCCLSHILCLFTRHRLRII